MPLVSDRSPVVAGWPAVAWPICDPALLQQLLVPASAIVLLGTLELAVSARAGGARPDMRREILAQGWANVGGAFTGCFPASASLTRSSLLRLSGGRTRMASALSGLVALPVLVFGSQLVGYIPQSALAGLLLVVAWGMVDKTAVRRLWAASPETRLLLALTYVATLVLPIEWAILLGSGTGLVIHLAHTSAPRLHLLRPEGPESRRLVPTTASEEPECVVVEVSGDLHYAAVPPFLNEVERLIPASARCIVLDLSHAHEIRFSALAGLRAAGRAGRLLRGHLRPGRCQRGGGGAARALWRLAARRAGGRRARPQRPPGAGGRAPGRAARLSPPGPASLRPPPLVFHRAASPSCHRRLPELECAP